MINIYCDESCHLEKDKSDIMLIGGMYCDEQYKDQIFKDIRRIKEQHGLSSWFEIKWTKVSYGKLEFYKAIVDYFFKNNNLFFRVVIAHNKNKLDHNKYNNGSYDLWYYKIYFLLLDKIISPTDEYRIFIDIKDTNGGPKVRKLQEVLCNNIYDFKQEVVKDIKQVNSRESEILQIADLIMGAMGYFDRGLCKSKNGKKELIDYIINNHDVQFDINTIKTEKKFNVFHWYPRRL